MGVSRSALLLLAILAALLYAPLALRVPNPYGSQLIREVHEASHTVLFFIVQITLLLYLRRTRPHWNLAYLMLGTALFSLTFGGIIELVQPLLQRERSWDDMGRNLFGIAGACAAFYATRTRLPHPITRRRRAAALGLAGAVLLGGFWPLLMAGYKQVLRDRDFPLLMNFDQPVTRGYVGRAARGKVKFQRAPAAWTDNPSQVARVWMPATARWSGFVLYNPWHDWSRFKALRFEVYSPHGQTVQIAVNIYSAENGMKILRYKAFDVGPGFNDFTMDLTTGASLEQHHITSVSWYSITKGQDLELYFDNLRLQ